MLTTKVHVPEKPIDIGDVDDAGNSDNNELIRGCGTVYMYRNSDTFLWFITVGVIAVIVAVIAFVVHRNALVAEQVNEKVEQIQDRYKIVRQVPGGSGAGGGGVAVAAGIAARDGVGPDRLLLLLPGRGGGGSSTCAAPTV